MTVLPLASVSGVSTAVMNSARWVVGGTTAPVLIGWLSTLYGLHRAIALAAGHSQAALLLTAAGSAISRAHGRFDPAPATFPF